MLTAMSSQPPVSLDQLIGSVMDAREGSEIDRLGVAVGLAQ